MRGYTNKQIEKSPKLQIKSYKLVAMHQCLGKLPFWNTKTFIIWRPAYASSFVDLNKSMYHHHTLFRSICQKAIQSYF